ncbi:MAG: chaperone modulator CbpM [Hyphomicrobium aestuarii]|nr:chaperone modulator CbpM [Hyphomicrobium aestuarii]
MIAPNDFVLRARIDHDELASWIDAGWLQPTARENDRAFSEIDLARAQLISDLTQDLGLNEEGVAVALTLVDQLHGVRRILRDLLDAVSAQPEDARTAIFLALRSARNN